MVKFCSVLIEPKSEFEKVVSPTVDAGGGAWRQVSQGHERAPGGRTKVWQCSRHCISFTTALYLARCASHRPLQLVSRLHVLKQITRRATHLKGQKFFSNVDQPRSGSVRAPPRCGPVGQRCGSLRSRRVRGVPAVRAFQSTAGPGIALANPHAQGADAVCGKRVGVVAYTTRHTLLFDTLDSKHVSVRRSGKYSVCSTASAS